MIRDKAGIYVHIPFCVKKCNYCDFNSYGGCFEKEESYFDALNTEIIKKGQEYKDISFDTVYIGGGTPTSVSADNISAVMDNIKKSFNLCDDREITIECNPKTADKADFKKYIDCGINRLSIGLQSTEDSMLNALGRIHSAADFEKCLKDASEAGFENISADLMFALPGQSFEVWEKTLEKAADYGLSHISCYALKVEEGTPFYNMKLNLPDEDLSADMYEAAVEILEKNGYKRYEISNFAKEGRESVHNIKYWSYLPYIGLGAGAYSSFCGKRWANTLKTDDYISEIKSGRLTKCDAITLSENEEMSEYMFMGLRKVRGIDAEDFYNRFGKSVYEVFEAPLKKYLKLGVLNENNGRIYINKKMLYISNGILCDFV